MKMAAELGGQVEASRQYDLVSRALGATDINEQWWRLESAFMFCDSDEPSTRLLLDFAEDVSQPLTIRAKALDMGIDALHDIRKNAQSGGNSLSADLEATYQALETLIPGYFTPWPSKARKWWPEHQGPNRPYHWAWGNIGRHEGLKETHLFPDHYDMSCDPQEESDNIPIAAGMLLDRLVGEEESHVRHMPASMLTEALSFAINFQSPDYYAVLSGMRTVPIVEAARLARFTKQGGLEHDVPIEFLYRLPEQQRAAYIETFNALYASAQGLRDVFPEVMGDKIVAGAQGLLANALFAVQAHFEAGQQTHAAITLKNGGELAVDFEGDEPLEVLQQLDSAFRTLHWAVTADTARSVKVAEGPGFQIDRFIDLASTLPPAVTLYTRPFESVSYDPMYEYGRPGVGVEASVSYKVQVGGDGLLPLNKQTPNTNVISIRLDREHDGVISLDIGSVLGNPASLGTKVGRLLGWGNSLRSVVTGKVSGLNHVKDKLDQQYGQEAGFAYITVMARDRTEAMRASEGELRAYVSAVRKRLAAFVLAS